MKTGKLHNKTYEAPAIEITDIVVEQSILSGSNGKGKTSYHFENDNIEDLILD